VPNTLREDRSEPGAETFLRVRVPPCGLKWRVRKLYLQSVKTQEVACAATFWVWLLNIWNSPIDARECSFRKRVNSLLLKGLEGVFSSTAWKKSVDRAEQASRHGELITFPFFGGDINSCNDQNRKQCLLCVFVSKTETTCPYCKDISEQDTVNYGHN
jgi:hypothetical protein